METRAVTPEDVGLKRGRLDDLRIDSPEQSAAAIRSILLGEGGSRRDHTLFNAAAALVAAGVAGDLAEGVRRSTEAIDSQAAARTLERWVAFSRADAP